MRWLIVLLAILLSLVAYPLWQGYGGWLHLQNLRQDLAAAQQHNEILHQRNALLLLEIQDLKNGSEAMEERARMDLGMQKKNEVFIYILPN